MDPKTIQVLEYPKVLERLARSCDFSASMELARALAPTDSHDLAIAWLAETSEARALLAVQDIGVGAAHDIRPQAELAARGGVLDPQHLLDIKSTLISCRDLRKYFDRSAERERHSTAGQAQYPRLSQIVVGLPDTFGLVDAITRTLSDRGDVLDSASQKLADIRRNMRFAHDRLMGRLQKYITDSRTASMLQEPIITQRDGRYVIPLRAEFKGRIKSIVHDQSSSGATLFVEPLPIVEANNALRELQLAERDEERRILAELSAQIGAHADELRYGVENLAALDLAFAKAKFAEELRASEPVLHSTKANSQPSEAAQPSADSAIHLLQARHPLLDPGTVVPVDFDPRPGTRAVVITGPNTGGKTVSLKTVGLLVLMAQSGLHIPAQSGSELPCFAAIYADIGDEQSIEQSLSTFSGHLSNIIRILQHADARSLVLLDELGAGTDPQEGAALARAILSRLLAGGITSLIATHYPELKTFAHSTEGVVNASLEFDIKTLRPTYHLTIGLPGRSNALLIAQRLGLEPAIIDAARAEINPADLRADKLLDDIRKERNRSAREREKLEKVRLRLEQKARDLERRLDRIEEERREVLARARAEGELEVAVLKENLESLRSQVQNTVQPLRTITAVEEQLETLEENIEAPVTRRPTARVLSVSDSELPPAVAAAVGKRPPWSARVGGSAHLTYLKTEGVITALSGSDAEVQVGSVRVRVRLGDLEEPRAGSVGPKSINTDRRGRIEESPRGSMASAVTPASPGLELSLRGKLVEDGLDELERYLEKAYAAGLPFVRIVHGKGTGRMRSAVRAALKENPYVSSFEFGSDREGGEGVTVATLSR